MSTVGINESQLLIKHVESQANRTAAEGEISFGSRFERFLTTAEILADWLTVLFAMNCGYAFYHLLGFGRTFHYTAGTLFYISAAIAAFYVLLLDRDGAYRSSNSLLRIKETERSLRVSFQAFVLILPITFFSNYAFLRWVFLIAMLFVPLLQAIEKQLLFNVLRALRARNVGVQRVLVYGAGTSGRRVVSAILRAPKLGLTPVALIDDDPELRGQEVFEYAYRRGQSVQVISGPVTRELLRRYQCGMLVIAIPSLGREKFSSAVQAARSSGVRLAYIPGQAIASDYWTEYADIDGILLSVFGQPAHQWQYEAIKRVFDFLAAITLLILLFPLCLALALMIRLDSPGPVLFRQQRVGKNSKLFTLYKFRTMGVTAPAYQFSPTESNDPRITRVGRFLRRTSLDELAQLINVVKGDMSLVGPRPEMPFIVEQYSTAHTQRLRVKPGITGLWQLSADRAFQIHENIQYDLYYIRHRSFFMDFAILLHTMIFAMHGV
jgi:exopolysaccharide biosynthesis polyprenyl glycosylphosphotransferase